jgi:four helix bundle protein
MELEDLRIYKQALDLGEKIWTLVIKWNNLAIDTIGKQLIKSSDSISANISEGFGRYHIRETRNFCYIARGSLFETKTWLTKAFNRELIPLNIYEELVKDLKDLGIKLNNYIRTISKNLPDQVKEDTIPYGLTSNDFIKIFNDL